MPTCQNCSATLRNGAKFCNKCGNRIDDSAASFNNPFGDENVTSPPAAKRKSKPKPKAAPVTVDDIGDETNCPVCGTPIGRGDLACYACGAPLAHYKLVASVRSFAAELSRLESQPLSEEEPESAWGAFLNGSRDEREKAYGSKAFDRRVSFIKSFPIPDSVDEIIEFILLAVANIDTKYGKRAYDYNGQAAPGYLIYSDVTLSYAWVCKLDQAYNKAKLMFPDDPRFPEIKRIYENKMKQLSRLSSKGALL